MRNNDLLSLQGLYSDLYTRLVEEENDPTNVAQEDPNQPIASPAQQLSAIIEPLPNFKWSEIASAFKHEVSDEEDLFSAGSIALKKFTQQALIEALDRFWDLNLERSKTREGQYHNMYIFGDLSSGKTRSIRTFCTGKAEEMGKAEAAKELYAKFPGLVEEETGYLDFTIIQNHKKLLAEYLAHPEKYFILLNFDLQEFTKYDFRGIPDLTSDQPYLEEQKYAWLYAISQPGATGVLFLDEFNRADQDVFNVMLPLLEAHRLGGMKIRDSILIAAAGNISTTGEPVGGTIDLKDYQALMSRFKKGYLVLDPFEWLDDAEQRGVDDDVVDFVKIEPYRNLGLMNQPAIGDTHLKGVEEQERGIAFPSPRSVEAFNQEYKAFKEKSKKALVEFMAAQKQGRQPDSKLIRIPNVYEVIKDISSFSCGPDWGRKFYKFIMLKEKFNLKELAAKGESLRSSNTGLELYPLPGALIEVIKASKKNVQPLIDKLFEVPDSDSADPAKTEAYLQKTTQDFLNTASPIQKKSFDDLLDSVKIFNNAPEEIQVQFIKRVTNERFLPKDYKDFFLAFGTLAPLDSKLKENFEKNTSKVSQLTKKYTGDEELKKRRGMTK